MKNNMIYLDISLETVGPVFVGSGEAYQKSEYILDQYKNKIYIMDTLKMFKGLKKINKLGEYEKWIMSQPKQANLFYFIKQHDIRANIYSQWARYEFTVDNAAELKSWNIMPCVKDAYNNPYIPGSTLKGAIRNAVLNSELITHDEIKDIADRVYDNSKIMKNRQNYLRNEANELDTRLFNTLNRTDEKGKPVKAENAVNSIFQGLRISDSQPLPLNSLGLYGKVDINPDNFKRSLNLMRECIKPGTVIRFSVEIDPDIFPYSIEDIQKCINNMYRSTLKRHLDYFPNPRKYTDNMLYVGGGSGFISKTAVMSLFEDRDDAVDAISQILDNTDSTNKGKKVGKHLEDPDMYDVSPHMKKITVSGGRTYEFGLCRCMMQQKNL